MGPLEETFAQESSLRKSERIWAKTLNREDFPITMSGSGVARLGANP